MKILHIVQFLGIGGLEKVLNLLILEQMKQGHHVELIVYDYNRDWVDNFREQGIIVHTDYLKTPGYDAKLWKYFYSKSKAFDVIHTHDLNPIMYVSLLKFLRPLFTIPKIIHTTHGMEHIDEGKKYQIFEKVISRLADKIIGVSPAIKDYYINELKASPQKVLNIDNGTPVQEVLPAYKESRENLKQRFNIDNDNEIWCVIARVVPLKDQKFLIEQLNGKKINLLIVGPSGNGDYMNEIKEIAQDNIYIVGGQEKIEEILAGSDLFVSASHHEGIPIAVLEAGSMGIPCLLSNIPGHQTLQHQSKNDIAQFFDIEDKESFSSAIHELSLERKELLRENLHKLVFEQYSIQKMANEYLESYKDINVK